MNRRAPAGADRGAVTAELAIGMIAVVAVLAVILAAGAASVARVRCTEAARAGARAASIGRDDAAVRSTVTRVAGADASVSIERQDDGWVVVAVQVPVVDAGLARGLRASATATAWLEP
ncbi:MAG: pilus assembly protein TadE [Cellulomonas sp.]|nr:pilus assembly protein TadE [Cellulomonas sp.]